MAWHLFASCSFKKIVDLYKLNEFDFNVYQKKMKLEGINKRSMTLYNCFLYDSIMSLKTVVETWLSSHWNLTSTLSFFVS